MIVGNRYSGKRHQCPWSWCLIFHPSYPRGGGGKFAPFEVQIGHYFRDNALVSSRNAIFEAWECSWKPTYCEQRMSKVEMQRCDRELWVYNHTSGTKITNTIVHLPITNFWGKWRYIERLLPFYFVPNNSVMLYLYFQIHQQLFPNLARIGGSYMYINLPLFSAINLFWSKQTARPVPISVLYFTSQPRGHGKEFDSRQNNRVCVLSWP